MQGIDKRGRAVAFVGGSSSVIAAAGSGTQGNISIWDTTSPVDESCIGRLDHHKSEVGCLCTLPGGWLLACGDDAGKLSVTDVRMLGSSSSKGRVLWSIRASHGKLTAMETISLGDIQQKPKRFAIGVASGLGSGIVVGGTDGILRIWEASTGALLQETDPIYTPTPKASRLLSLTSVDPKYSITDIAVCEEGIITSGTDGLVRLFPAL